MHVAMITTALSMNGAGVHEAVRGLATHLPSAADIRVTVIGSVSDAAAWDRDAAGWDSPGLDVTAVRGGGAGGFARLVRAAQSLRGRSIDVVHAHGLWNGPTVASALLARRVDCPLVISPHGMLERWALDHNAMHKFVPWHAWERRITASAGLLQAMSDHEHRGFRACGFRNPAMVHPLGLDFGAVLPRSPSRTGSRTCLFLSRLHPVKGLPAFMEAWHSVRPAGWRLVIVGPDEGGHRQELEAAATASGLHDCVEFHGPAYGQEKWRRFAAADLFALPSYSENFGLVVAEAMAAGLPVITTTGTPWKVLSDERLGWWVDPTPTALAAALADATTRSCSSLGKMGEAAAFYARNHFSWSSIASDMGAAYRWLVGGGPAPPTLRFADDAHS